MASAEPGTSAVWCAHGVCALPYALKRSFVVRRGAFYPQPGVDSAVVVLEPLDPPRPPPSDELRRREGQAGKRRKTLRNAWRGIFEPSMPVASWRGRRDSARRLGETPRRWRLRAHQRAVERSANGGSMSRAATRRGFASWVRRAGAWHWVGAGALLVLLAGAACRSVERSGSGEPAITAEFGIFYGGQVQEREQIPFELTGRASSGFRLRRSAPPRRSTRIRLGAGHARQRAPKSRQSRALGSTASSSARAGTLAPKKPCSSRCCRLLQGIPPGSQERIAFPARQSRCADAPAGSLCDPGGGRCRKQRTPAEVRPFARRSVRRRVVAGPAGLAVCGTSRPGGSPVKPRIVGGAVAAAPEQRPPRARDRPAPHARCCPVPPEAVVGFVRLFQIEATGPVDGGLGGVICPLGPRFCLVDLHVSADGDLRDRRPWCS